MSEEKKNSFNLNKEYLWESWVPLKIKDQIEDFWGCFGRTYKDWLIDSKRIEDIPRYGQDVVFEIRGQFYRGRYVHAWNNMGRLILGSESYKVVSNCDSWWPVEEFAQLQAGANI